MAKPFILSDQDRLVLQRLLDAERRRSPGTMRRPNTPDLFDNWMAPDVYIALIPTGGIDGTTDVSLDTYMDSAECQIYTEVADTSGMIYLDEIPLTLEVYNPTTVALAADTFVAIKRTKGGKWIADPQPSAGTAVSYPAVEHSGQSNNGSSTNYLDVSTPFPTTGVVLVFAVTATNSIGPFATPTGWTALASGEFDATNHRHYWFGYRMSGTGGSSTTQFLAVGTGYIAGASISVSKCGTPSINVSATGHTAYPHFTDMDPVDDGATIIALTAGNTVTYDGVWPLTGYTDPLPGLSDSGFGIIRGWGRTQCFLPWSDAEAPAVSAGRTEEKYIQNTGSNYWVTCQVVLPPI